MEWISSMFSWEMAALAGMAVLGAAALILIRRIWKGGLGTFEQSTRKMQQRISDTDAEIRDHNLAMPPGEQLHIVEAALWELLELEGKPAGFGVRRTEKSLCLTTPSGDMEIMYTVRQSTLRSAGRVMRGAAHWQVSHCGQTQVFSDLAPLMRFLRSTVSPRARAEAVPPPPSLQARCAGRRVSRASVKAKL